MLYENVDSLRSTKNMVSFARIIATKPVLVTNQLRSVHMALESRVSVLIGLEHELVRSLHSLTSLDSLRTTSTI